MFEKIEIIFLESTFYDMLISDAAYSNLLRRKSNLWKSAKRAHSKRNSVISLPVLTASFELFIEQ